MKQISVSVRCTREEYMAFCVEQSPKLPWLTGMGIVWLILAALSIVMDSGITSGGALLLLVGVLCMMMSPLILPMVRKGEAGRRYDASDSLSQAVSLVIDEKTLTVRSAALEGTLPLDTMNDTVVTSGMIALVFGKELTVCIPRRALSDEEQQTLLQILETVLKGKEHDE